MKNSPFRQDLVKCWEALQRAAFWGVVFYALAVAFWQTYDWVHFGFGGCA